MKFIIAVEVAAMGPMTQLVQEIQVAYDNGADGLFQCIVTHSPSYMILFERTTDDVDADYLLGLMQKHSLSVREAAQMQLALELEGGSDASSNKYMSSILETLRNYDAQIVDFAGALDERFQAADKAD